MKRTALSLSLLLTAACLTLTACSGKVTGEVSGKSNSKPVPQATVVVGGQTVVTDSTGHFTVDKVGTGSQTVTATAQGFGDFAGSVDVKRGSDTLNIVLVDGIVHGVLTENAVVREATKGAKVTLGEEPAMSTKGAKFDLEGVSVGIQTLKVEVPGHATYKKQVEIKPGDNQLKIQLELTPVETYMRYYSSYRFGRFSDGYKFLHPVVKKHYSFKRFKTVMAVGTVVGIKIFGTKHLAKWKPAYAKVTFKDIIAIDRALRTQTVYGTYTDNYTQHWQQLHGRWYIIFDWRK